MRKPAVLFGAVPVLHLRRDGDNRARFQADRRLALLLIPAAPRGADQELAAAALRVMDMPVIAAARLKCDVRQKNGEFAGDGEGIEIGVPDEKLRERGVLFSKTEHVLPIKFFFAADSHKKSTLF